MKYLTKSHIHKCFSLIIALIVAETAWWLQVDILDLAPRGNPLSGKTYGSNAAANWGYQFRAGFLDGKPREVVTIYEILRDESGDLMWAVPDYQFQ